MPRFEVTTPGGRYSVIVERGALSSLPYHLPANHGQPFLITEQRVWSALQDAVSGFDYPLLFLPGGEENKRLAPLEKLAEQMIERGADRASIIIALGGGIVNDMAGFLAAIFLRGIPVIQAPTTLLAQVDASIGGKTGVNLTHGKNLIGSFHQPLAVLIDPALLSTLPEREYRAGLYEVIKSAVIASPSLFELLRESRDAILAREPAVVDRLIAECVRIKTEVVSADERESGVRRILNFGHTVGHAIEAATHYTRFLHGEAVALGMKAAVHLARDCRSLSGPDAQSILSVIRQYGPVPDARDLAVDQLVTLLARDKKTRNGQIHFVLPISIGETEVVAGLPESSISEAIEQALA